MLIITLFDIIIIIIQRSLFSFLEDLPSDTLASILYLKSIFPRKVFEGLLPPIILKHQIYCVVKDKTLVDRQLVRILNMKF